jgi:hypothetical protein
MAKINEVLVKILGLPSDPASLNYYNLLQLPPFTSDSQQITTAIQAAVARMRAAASNESAETIDAVKKVLQQCHAILTAPEKKRAYDNQLRALLKKTATTAAATTGTRTTNTPTKTASTPVAPESKPLATTVPVPSIPQFVPRAVDPLAEYLPPGDPYAEFSMKDHLASASASSPVESIESRLAEIDKLRTGLASDATYAARHHLINDTGYGESSPQNETMQIGSIQQRIRRKRAAKNALAVGGLCLISIVLLATAVWKYMDRAEQTAQSSRPSALNRTAANTETPSPGQTAKSDVPAPETSTNANVEPTMELPSVKANPQEIQSHFSDVPGQEVPMNNASGEMKAASNQTQSMPQANRGSEATWDQTLQQTRESIGKKNFDLFNDSVNELMAMEISDLQKDEVRQVVDRTGQLYKVGCDAFDGSIKKLQSGETLTTGDDTISIVEAKENELIFRIKGKNTTYKRNELPSDIVVALLNLELDPKAPVDVASRGVFFKLYNAGQDYQKLGDKYLSQAAQVDPKYSKIDDLTNPAYHPG